MKVLTPLVGAHLVGIREIPYLQKNAAQQKPSTPSPNFGTKTQEPPTKMGWMTLYFARFFFGSQTSTSDLRSWLILTEKETHFHHLDCGGLLQLYLYPQNWNDVCRFFGSDSPQPKLPKTKPLTLQKLTEGNPPHKLCQIAQGGSFK